MGLIVLILVGIVPATFALDMHTSAETIAKLNADSSAFEMQLQKSGPVTIGNDVVAAERC